MIPKFPQFKNIELSDKPDMEKITSQFPPYSDFNFMSIWSWDIKKEIQISKLNENLVMRFTDYTNGQPFYTFLGNNSVNETAETLLNAAMREKLRPSLSLIPEDSILEMSKEKFKIMEDRDNFDYIYDLKEISTYKDSKFGKKRNMVNKFLKSFPNARIEIVDLNDEAIRAGIINLDKSWAERKVERDSNYKFENEILATKRFFEGNFSNVVGVELFNKQELIGYSILEIYSDSEYASSHFCKAKTNFAGVYDYLIKESAKVLLSRGCTKLNYEQDLGLTGLRFTKSSFSSSFLKKHVIMSL